MSVTFFTVVRPFAGEFDALQRQAIRSWAGAVPGSETILMGDGSVPQPDVERVAAELGCRVGPVLPSNDHGTALVCGAFAAAERLARPDWLCEVSADVVLGADLAEALHALRRVERPFVIGQRWDIEPGALPGSAVLHPPSGVDYFLYRRGTLGEIPPFAVGRTAYDDWLVWAAMERWGLQVIDATQAITAIHVNHGYPRWPDGKAGMLHSEEREENHRLAWATGCPRWYSIHDAPWVLVGGKVVVRCPG